MLLVEVFIIGQLYVTHQDILLVVCPVSVRLADLRDRLDVFREVLLVLLHVVGIRTEGTQFQSVEDSPSQFTMYVDVGVLLPILDLQAA